MSNSFCTVATAALERSFSALERDLREGIVLKALKAGGEELQARTREELKRRLGPGATSTRTTKKPMVKGVTNKVDKAYDEVRVTIMGDYRLKWFELGTRERKLLRTGAKDRSRARYSADKRYLYRKKGKENRYRAGESRGRIRPLGFFAAARADSAPVEKAIEKTFYSLIQKAFK